MASTGAVFATGVRKKVAGITEEARNAASDGLQDLDLPDAGVEQIGDIVKAGPEPGVAPEDAMKQGIEDAKAVGIGTAAAVAVCAKPATRRLPAVAAVATVAAGAAPAAGLPG